MTIPKRDNTSGAWIRDVGNAMTHSVELVLGLMLGIGLGLLVQRRWPGLDPWGIILGFLLGVGAVIRSIQRMVAESATQDANRQTEDQA